MERSLQQSTTTFESATLRLVTSETFGCTPRAKFECCLVASSRNGLVQTKDRHQEPSLNYEIMFLLQARSSGTSPVGRKPGVISVAAQTELSLPRGVRWPRFVACWYHRRSKGSRSGGTTTPSHKEGNISIRSRRRASPRV